LLVVEVQAVVEVIEEVAVALVDLELAQDYL
jgi:hypothetical protein